MNWEMYCKALFALVIWREARGEGLIGMRAVAHVIRNRVLAKHLPDSWEQVIDSPKQFTSMTYASDSMLIKWPSKDDEAFKIAMGVAVDVYTGTDPDLTQGATMYANLSVCSPEWNFSKLKKTVILGKHTFFKEI